ncbi:MAG: BglII/BstYI family type II restriction endonuclease [Stellaceae bacterium]
MRIAQYYSHLNGHEYLIAKKPHLWAEIEQVIENVEASQFRTKVSKEKTMSGAQLYSPGALNRAFDEEFRRHGWAEQRTDFWVTENPKLIRDTLNLKPDNQRKLIEQAGGQAYHSYNQTDFVKDRVAVEVQFGKYFAVAYDLFVKHLAFYIGDVIDLGVEIVPMRELSAATLRDGKRTRNMSIGVSWYEKELYNLIREGLGIPASRWFLLALHVRR